MGSQTDINSYANDLLLDFLDAFHASVKADLTQEFGDSWLELGVLKHFKPAYFDRTKEMLVSPMRVVDMGKSDEELYGVEHLSNIVMGNWSVVYKKRLEDKNRVGVYLGEIAEIRHNVSHRRRRHVLRRSEVVRFTQNCAMLLRGVESPEAQRFTDIAESMSAGATPWGASLGGYVPPRDEIVHQFVGRSEQLRELTTWLAGDSPQLLVWGYGGAGKSALAYEFAREMREAAPLGLNAIAWISAKRTEFVAGTARPRKADFTDRKSIVSAVLSAIYETDFSGEDHSEEDLLEQLRELPVLLVVDDFDTVITDDALVEFLMHDVRSTRSRVLYTSREKVTGIRSLEVLGLEGEDLNDFIKLRAFEHGLDFKPCIERAQAIRSVTSGFPLFIDDLLRYARMEGIKRALEDWGQRKGDAAREYALRRQLEQLGPAAQNALIALSVANRPLTVLEISDLIGATQGDAHNAIEKLLSWRLTDRLPQAEERPAFTVNLNTKRLVLTTYSTDERLESYRAQLRVLGSTRVPAARQATIAMAIGGARALVMRGDIERAISVLHEDMTGELSESPELFGALGWAYSRVPEKYEDEARQAFERAYELGATREDTYLHWADLEVRAAGSSVARIPDSQLLERWRKAAHVAETGLKVSGVTKGLCLLAGYSRSREAKTLQRLNEFTKAERASAKAVGHLRRGLAAPQSSARDVSPDNLYRSLVISLEGLGDHEAIASVREEWESVSRAGASRFFETQQGARRD